MFNKFIFISPKYVQIQTYNNSHLIILSNYWLSQSIIIIIRLFHRFLFFTIFLFNFNCFSSWTIVSSKHSTLLLLLLLHRSFASRPFVLLAFFLFFCISFIHVRQIVFLLNIVIFIFLFFALLKETIQISLKIFLKT